MRLEDALATYITSAKSVRGLIRHGVLRAVLGFS
jgi:hypothetical protein